ncbi:alpha/beta fold hydrolase [Cytobacillus gottheilii]|uniref:Alpha/beta hydrolase n=1 Tax=Cytobacillus gottheilii TaxID=859144 RepID=A0ABX8FED4_9BACI|nr:alpha/beta hydrolase [Cytobacillus gottheilii]QVY62377.1 alpha/beta hydrolase [Cytobacillus gottheilii]
MERVVETVSINGRQLEYSILGEGEPILVMHGGHSNCYEEFGYKSLLDNGFSIITPSRPGYGRTVKEIGENLASACEYYLDLLNQLGIDKLHVIGISAGGPSAIYFAAHYPQHVKTLILQSAVTKEWLTPEDLTYKLAHVIFHPRIEKTTWTLLSRINQLFPAFIFKQMFSSFSSLSYREAKKRIGTNDIEEVRKMNNRQRSGHGFLIDLKQVNELPGNELEKVLCPTLILHSAFDGSVPLEHAYYAAEKISDAKIYVLDSWGHLIWLGKSASDMNEALMEFLNNNY